MVILTTKYAIAAPSHFSFQLYSNITERHNKSLFEVLTMDKISRILAFILNPYLELLYFSTSIALISAVAKFVRGSDNFGTSCYKTGSKMVIIIQG